MAAPKAVKDKAALAESLIARAAEGKTPKGNPPVEGITPAPTYQPPAVVTPVLAGDPSAPPQPVGANPYAVHPAPQPGQAPNLAVVEPGPTKDWEHKYNVLQGMFDTYRRDSISREEQLSDQLRALTQMANARPSSQDTFHPEATPDIGSYGLSEEEIESMGGEDFVKSIAKISNAQLHTEIASLKTELNSLNEKQTGTLEEMFYTNLERECPNWAVINKLPAFDVWLEQPDGLSGILRSTFLQNAYREQDATTVARYFNQFAALQTMEPGANPDVLTDVIPGGTGGGTPPSSKGGNIYTRQSIAQFFKDRGLGKFKGREAEAEAIERDIFAAQNEGRVLMRPPPRRVTNT